MAYVVSGKEKSKRRKERRRQSRRSLSLPKDDDVDAVSSQPVDRSAPPLHLQHSSNKHLEGNASSSAAYHGSAAAEANNVAESADCTDSLADDMLRLPGNSNLQQQLPQQMHQSSSTNLPTSVDNPQLVNQNGLIQVLAQAVQQRRQHHHDHHQQRQQQHQQQLILQSTLSQNLSGQFLQTTQTPLQSASLDGLTQLLAQAQQQQQLIQQQQQQQQQQFILVQHLLNQQNVLSSDSLQTNLSSAAQGVLPSNGILLGGASSNYLSAPQSAPAANNNISQNLQLQSNTPNALMLGSMLSNLQNQPNDIGMLSATQGAQQLDQLQRSLMLQQNQLLASILTASNQLVVQPQQQQQPTWQQIALLGQIQN
jgi:hypothetical protein